MSFLSTIIVLPFYSLKRAEVLNLNFRPPVRTLVPYYIVRELKLPPHHLVDYAYIALDNLHHLCGDIFIYIVRDWDAVVAILAKCHRGIYRLNKALGIDAGYDEVTLVNSLGTLGRSTDADGREGMAYTGEETALLGECAAVADYGKGVHL